MSGAIGAGRLVVVTATALEAKAARRLLPRIAVVEAGIALVKLRGTALAEAAAVVSCGLAGGLHARYPSGTVLVPREVRRPSGGVLRCDPELVAALAAASRRLGYEPVGEPLLTSAAIVRGGERAAWSEAGYAAVDMETGLLDLPRVAAVRVVLDTPLHELSADWLHPGRALANPKNWPEALWLARYAARYARRAAAVVSAAFPLSRR